VDAILTDTNGFWGNFTAVKLNVAVVNASNDSAIKIDTKRHVGG
jgi:allantoicase